MKPMTEVMDTIRKGAAHTLCVSDVQKTVDTIVAAAMKANGYKYDEATVMAAFFKNSPEGALLYEALTVAQPDPKPERVEAPPDEFDARVAAVAKSVAARTGMTEAAAVAHVYTERPDLYVEYLRKEGELPSNANEPLRKLVSDRRGL